jgi:hypothetical protein
MIRPSAPGPLGPLDPVRIRFALKRDSSVSTTGAKYPRACAREASTTGSDAARYPAASADDLSPSELGPVIDVNQADRG